MVFQRLGRNRKLKTSSSRAISLKSWQFVYFLPQVWHTVGIKVCPLPKSLLVSGPEGRV